MEKKLLCFDLDGTLSLVSSWVYVNALFGITPEEDKELFEQYVRGSLQYDAWTKALVAIYKQHNPVTRQGMTELAGSLPLRDDAVQAIQDAKEKGYTVIVISGSLDVIVESIAMKVGADGWIACNKAVFNEQDMLIDIVSMGDESPSKLELVSAYCAKEGIELSTVITVGDGGNDKELFKHAKGIVLGDNTELQEIAWKKVETLSEIKDLI